MPLCKLCGKNEATVPEREHGPDWWRKEVCRQCRGARLLADLATLRRWWGKVLCRLGRHDLDDGAEVPSEHRPELPEFRVRVGCRRCGEWWIV